MSADNKITHKRKHDVALWNDVGLVELSGKSSTLIGCIKYCHGVKEAF